jgi:hypothetical protein
LPLCGELAAEPIGLGSITDRRMRSSAFIAPNQRRIQCSRAGLPWAIAVPRAVDRVNIIFQNPIQGIV